MTGIVWTTEYASLEISVVNTVERNVSTLFSHDYPHGFAFPFDCLLAFVAGDDNDILERYAATRKRFHSNLIVPFAWDKKLHEFCFDYRKDTENPCIIYLGTKESFETDSSQRTFFVCQHFKDLEHMFY